MLPKKDHLKASRKVSGRNTRPETELLLYCARSCIDSEAADLIRAMLRENVDWTYLIRTASRHGVMPLLFWSLNTVCSESVPKGVLNQLRDHFRSNAHHNLLLTGELLTLLRVFETHGISAIPFKGPALAAFAYDNLALRQFNDLDILLYKRDVPRARDLLISDGYQSLFQWTRAQEAFELQSNHEYELVHKDGEIVVDLHWLIAPSQFSFPFDTECLWEHLEPISLTGATVMTLSPEDMLLFLCVHGSKHLWERLAWICDVSELIRVNPALDWEWVIAQATAGGVKRMLLLGLSLANELVGARIRDEVLQMVQTDSKVLTLTRQVGERLFQDNLPHLSLSERRLFHLRAMERWQDRVRYCIIVAGKPRSTDCAFVTLPRELFFLYYLIRPIRLVSKYGLSPLKYLIESLRRFLRTQLLTNSG